MSKQYRYPGVTPFAREQEHLFFGRDEDVDRLYKLVQREQLVILHGKSGLGKSSLVNAGLLPRLEAVGQYAPVTIRLGAYDGDDATTPLEKTKERFTARDPLLERLLPGDTALWTYAKAQRMQTGRPPLLIFDQFEELFSYPEERVQAFQQELAELLHAALPLRYRRSLESVTDLSEEQEDRLEETLSARVLLAIRSDRLHLLDRLKTYFPNVLRHGLELQAFRPADARAAIERPAALTGDYHSAPYGYAPAALDRLLAYLQDEEGRVEGILLQMLCEHYERKVVMPDGIRTLTTDQLGDPASVVRDYYREKIDALPPERRAAARAMIEEGLASEGENAMRLSLHETLIGRQYGVDAPLLRMLVNERLLRSEPFLRGGYTYELSHDRLLPAVVEARARRRAREAEDRRAEVAARVFAEAKAERAARKAATRRLRRTRLLLLVAVVALAVAGYFGYRANVQADKLKVQTEALRTATATAEAARAEAERRLADYEEAERQRKAAEISTLLNRAATYENLNQRELARNALRAALAIDSTRADVRERLERLE